MSTYTRTIRTTVGKIRRGDLIVGHDSHVAKVQRDHGIGQDVATLADGSSVALVDYASVYVERTYTRKPKGLRTSGGAGSTAYTRKAA